MIDRFRGNYAFLSNFYPSPIVYGGGEYPTVEHAYQAAKAIKDSDIESIRLATSPADAKQRGRWLRGIKPDWDEIKINVMRSLIRRKFDTGSALAMRLLETGDEELVEGNTWGDTFWGVCREKGDNWLGQLLMEQRTRLKRS